jgi:hypothetical protein
MIRTRTRITVPIAIALALLAGPVLTGCSVQNLVNQATGGKVSLPGKSIPKDFPSDIPLVKGTVVLGLGVNDGDKGKGWNVTIQVTGDNPYDGAAKQLEDAGYKSQGIVAPATDQGGTAAFDNGTYTIVMVVAKTDKNWTVNYTVASDTKQ